MYKPESRPCVNEWQLIDFSSTGKLICRAQISATSQKRDDAVVRNGTPISEEGATLVISLWSLLLFSPSISICPINLPIPDLPHYCLPIYSTSPIQLYPYSPIDFIQLCTPS